MRIVSRVSLACSAALVVAGCAKSDQATKDSAAGAAAVPAAAPAPAPAPAPAFSLADAAGKWQVRAVPDVGPDTTATNYVITATADTTGWVMAFPSGVKVPLQVTPSGDSLIIKTGSFASQRRKGVKVMTESAIRIQGGKIVGTSTAHYAKAGADSVLHLHIEGTKIP